jgi:hypothetical protein
LVSSWIDRLAEQGKSEVSSYLLTNLPREQQRYGDGFRPLSYVSAERLASGRDVVKGSGVQFEDGSSIEHLLPLDARGSLSLPSLAYLFCDQIKARLMSLLESTPISYAQLPGSGVGLALVQRREAVEKTRRELAEVGAELDERNAEVAALRNSKRLRGG